ncbi:FKBP-type peptidyl-prolyl cis-trans isomerase [Sphingomonas sp.]|uniref:FKBP-type peptidyl-prolyl cis-trans isomerase n=1 Tax=Sphingomonas sp. TaxID=28214 RepID=UPI0025E12192|nr:FKBP-type peptidyl-prolyl cis-trans isomerase [Sphingomonas sp.]MBV9528053.1 FKBP-type peptidyl-prolyl cis-trans isomerase [Sphingomonas sp.]
MSVATTVHEKHRGAPIMRVVAAFVLLIAAAIALAWLGAGSLRPAVSASGLQFRTISPGSGPTIQPTDAAMLDYILTSKDGTVFDSSETHGGPQPFTMDQVFPGFAEAMKRMQMGGQYRFTMPQSLAFIGTPPPPGWPKDSPLTFDVRVRKIVPGGAAMLQQQQMMQQEQQQGSAAPGAGAASNGSPQQ